MTRRSWTAVAVVALVAVVATVLTVTLAGDGAPAAVNVTAEAGLSDAASMEIVVPGDDGAEQWITITDRATVGRYAAALDRSLDLEASAGCEVRATLRFYTTDGAVRTIDVACDVAPRLRGSDDFWGGRSASAPAEFMTELESQLALLP